MAKDYQKTEWKDGETIVNETNMKNIENGIYLNRELLNALLPINKVELFYDDLDHSNYFGYTWELISQGRIPIGLDANDTDFNEIGKIGGEKKHKLIANELPPTYIYPNEGNNDPITGGFDTTTGVNYYSLKTGVTNNNSPKLTANNPIMHTALAHENMPPYIVMAYWKRVA